MKNNIIKIAALNACLTALYIVIVALFLFYAPKIFGPDRGNSVLVIIVMLSLLVFSVALVGMLIFGRPAFWYLDGRKNEAIFLLAHTLGIFLVITIIALFALYFAI